MTPSKIGINLLWLVPDVVGGTEEYTTRLLHGIAGRGSSEIAITLYVNRSFAAAHPGLVAAYPTVVAPIDGRNKPRRVFAESTWLARRARVDGVEVLHHAGGTIPAVRSVPAMVTIHDLQPLVLPARFNAVKQHYLRRRLPSSVEHSRLVVAVSEHTRTTIIELLGVDPDRVLVVSPGFDSAPAPDPPDEPSRTHAIDRPYFLYPAIAYPHKNHTVLLRAFARVAETQDVLLVLTGGEGPAEEVVAQEIAALGIGPRVRKLGRVPRAELDWMVRHAVALTFPSRYEGFGLPVLEAMGNGCPVIGATSTALPEVISSAGHLVDPDDVGGWAAAMLELLTDPDRRQRLVEAGIARSATYGWERSVEAALVAYRCALRMGAS
ncbi:MAG: glycosyltransferase family 4 protein [Acidimicrobiales bacterium]